VAGDSLLGRRQHVDSYKSTSLSLLVGDYSTFNPHARFSLQWEGREPRVFEPTDTSRRKWRPDMPTGAHWYTPELLRDLIAAYLTDERRGGRGRTVREFVAEFNGLSGSDKQRVVLAAAGLARAHLHDLASGDDVRMGDVRRLLDAMCRHTRPIRPEALGVLGKEYLAGSILSYGATKDSIRYHRVLGEDPDHRPFVLEMALGIRDADEGRRVIGGVNWTAMLGMPFPALDGLLGELRVEPHDPVVVIVHLAKPGVLFADKGKGHVAGLGEHALGYEGEGGGDARY
jgi:hypothetical protein